MTVVTVVPAKSSALLGDNIVIIMDFHKINRLIIVKQYSTVAWP